MQIAPTREHRRARPRAAYALLVVAGLFAILITQLLLSIALSEGAYEIATLQQERRELVRDQELLAENLQVLESPQHLASASISLGMVGSASTAYLQLDDGAVLGQAIAASTRDAIVLGPSGMTLIPNSLLTGVSIAPAQTDTTIPGEATAPGTEGSVASTSGPLPGISTR